MCFETRNAHVGPESIHAQASIYEKATTRKIAPTEVASLVAVSFRTALGGFVDIGKQIEKRGRIARWEALHLGCSGAQELRRQEFNELQDFRGVEKQFRAGFREVCCFLHARIFPRTIGQIRSHQKKFILLLVSRVLFSRCESRHPK